MHLDEEHRAVATQDLAGSLQDLQFIALAVDLHERHPGVGQLGVERDHRHRDDGPALEGGLRGRVEIRGGRGLVFGRRRGGLGGRHDVAIRAALEEHLARGIATGQSAQFDVLQTTVGHGGRGQFVQEGLRLETEDGQRTLAADEQRKIPDVGPHIDDGALFQRPQDRGNETEFGQQVLSDHQQRGDGLGPRGRMGQSARAEGHGHQTRGAVDPAEQRMELAAQRQRSDQARALDRSGRRIGNRAVGIRIWRAPSSTGARRRCQSRGRQGSGFLTLPPGGLASRRPSNLICPEAPIPGSLAAA